MVNNATSINKMNNYLTPETTGHNKKTSIYGVLNAGPGLRQA